MVWKALDALKSRLQYFIIISMAAGLANVYFFGGWEVPRKFLVGIVIFLVIYPLMINAKFEEVIRHLRHPRPIFCSFVVNFLLSPIIAYIIGIIFFRNYPELFIVLIFLSMVPTSAMSAAWTALSGASMSTVLYLIPANLLFAAFVALPIVLPLMVDGKIELNSFVIARTILIVFLLPMVLGDLTRRVLTARLGEKRLASINPRLGSVSAVGLVILLFLVMSLQRNAGLFEEGRLLLSIFPALIAYYGLLYGVSGVWARVLTAKEILPGEKAVVIVYTSVARHVNICLALVLTAFPLEQTAVMVIFLMAAYVLQVPSLAFYARHEGRRLAAGSP
ncbi:MAG: arsenic resistance protein [Desulfobacteraceae bacterium]